MKNSEGSRTEPCGTQYVIVVSLEGLPPTDFYLVLFGKYDLNQSRAILLIP